ncbi:hypothetical protein ABPG72_015488 [Tetrahymena utriculariae]
MNHNIKSILKILPLTFFRLFNLIFLKRALITENRGEELIASKKQNNQKPQIKFSNNQSTNLYPNSQQSNLPRSILNKLILYQNFIISFIIQLLAKFKQNPNFSIRIAINCFLR